MLRFRVKEIVFSNFYIHYAVFNDRRICPNLIKFGKSLSVSVRLIQILTHFSTECFLL